MKGHNNAKVSPLDKRDQRTVNAVMINGKYVDSSSALHIAEKFISVSVCLVALAALTALAIAFIF